jgi:hypothetical protein
VELFENILPADDTQATSNVELRVIGPYSSATLRTMCLEATTSSLPSADTPWLSRIEMITASATATREMMDYQDKTDIAELLQSKGHLKQFCRTTETDDELANAMAQELADRGVDATNDPIAFVSEWDTLYGRELPLTFMHYAGKLPFWPDLVSVPTVPGAPSNQHYGGHFFPYVYLRGIDGKLPGDPPSTAEQQSGTDEAKAQATANAEQSEGRDHSDYLLRLSDDLVAKDAEYRAHDWMGRGLRAVGVLGSDVYDKLMVLKALRSKLPGTLFFTTDLDARLFNPAEIGETHGLLVAAPFGLKLGPDYQGEIPPFRDSYQTSFFLATMMAIGSVKQAPNLHATRIFEIGRTQAIDISRGGSDPIHPARRDWEVLSLLLHRLWFGSALLFFAMLFVALAFFATAGLPNKHPQKAILYTVLMTMAAAGAAAVTVCLLAWWAGPTGEPMYLTEGVSIWPTEAIRIFAAVLALHFLCMSVASVRANRVDVEKSFDLDSSAARGINPTIREKPWSDLAGMTETDKPFEANHLWARYVALGLQRNRLWRVGALGATYVLFGWFAFRLFGFPHVPAANPFGRAADHVIFCITILMLAALALYAGDVALLLGKAISNLGRGATRWPPAIIARVAERKSLPKEAVSLWLDMRFIAARSTAIVPLALYPSIVLALMLLARSRFFADWDWPWSVALVALIGLLFTASCHFLLLRSAQHARKHALGLLSVMVEDAQWLPTKDAIERLIESVEEIREGAFASLLQFPAVSAVLLPLLAGVLEYLSRTQG